MAAALHYGLLEQAFHLARRAKKRPTQADLRRSVAASYYALFYLLIDEATKRICRGKNHAPLRHHLVRTFQHSNMRNVAEQFSRGPTSKFLCHVFDTKTLDERLVFVPSSFVSLQDARHDADYNLNKSFFKYQSLEFADISKGSFNSWKQIRTTTQTHTFFYWII